jgi:hypothetical protein
LLEEVGAFDAFKPVGGRFTESQVAQGIELIINAKRLPSHVHEYMLREAITTSDFPLLFGVIVENELLAHYRATVPDWGAYCKQGTRPNFNQHTIHQRTGLSNLLPEVSEKGEYLVAAPNAQHWHIQLKKWGQQFDISWEALINDGMGAFSDVAQQFAEAAISTEAFNVTSLFVVAAGPNPLLFGAPIATTLDDGTVVNVTNQGALALTIGNLQTTMALMAAQTDPTTGRPLGIKGKHLVVPDSLEFTARAIITSAFQQWTDTAAATNFPLPTTNITPQLGIQLHVNSEIDVIDASGNDAGTWYLFADTAQGWAMEYDRLRGHETPEVCMKASDKVTTTGTPLGPFTGDFATDNVFYRVRMVGNGTQLDPRYAYAQVST